MKKGSSIRRLTQLYLSYHLNKMTFIVLGIVLLIWCVVLLLNTGLPIEKDQYLIESNYFHINYLEQSIFFLEIIDGVIIAFLIGAELSTLALFDPMFVPNTSRIKIILAKLIANITLLMCMLILQIIFLFFIGVVVFPNFTVNYSDLLLILYCALPMIELLLLGELLAILINSYFIPILIFIVYILCQILFKINKIKIVLSIFLPKVEFGGRTFHLEGNLVIYFGICFVLGIGIALLFQKKDISNS
ncbi:MAG: hypothetical protein K2J93_02795 [Anaeroplasmataceae bacterium]|nr:hypothetical protein [Anaeroplasmataceae bacterium]